MPREVETCWMIWEVKPGPLSDWIEEGSLNRGIMWLRRKSATVSTVSLVVGWASIQPENVSTKVKIAEFFMGRHVCEVDLPILSWEVFT